MREAWLKHTIGLRSELSVAAENFSWEEKLFLVQMPSIPKDMDEQITVTQKGVDVVQFANKQSCLTLLHYKNDRLENSHDSVPVFARKKEGDKFQQNVHVNFKLDEFQSSIVILISVYNKIIANQLILKSRKSNCKYRLLIILFSIRVKLRLNTGDNSYQFFKLTSRKNL